jgi:phosphate transport system permease protein
MAFGLFWLAWILWRPCAWVWGLVLATVHQMTPPPNEVGGLANAIFGSLMMVVLATFVGTPIGIMAGIYLAEYDPQRLAGQRDPLCQRHPAVGAVDRDRPVRLCRGGGALQEFSGWAGVMALALIVIPVVIRTTENMLQLVPPGLREAAYALGTPKWKVILRSR